VLVLSRFAGAAAEFTSALLVNPYDPEAVASAILRALEMPLAERKQRHAALWRALLDNDIAGWGDRFLAALSDPGRRPSSYDRNRQGRMPPPAPRPNRLSSAAE
jgi:trehalose 6-phosphate synthase